MEKREFNLGNLIKSLQPGDVINSNVKSHDDIIVVSLVVLRLEKKGKLYLSYPSYKKPCDIVDRFNPYVWDEEKNVLINHKGEVPSWYSNDISIEREAGLNIVEDYNKIPRSSGDFKYPEEQMAAFPNSDRCKIIIGILVNEESGSELEQIYITLKEIGLNFNTEQLIEIYYLFKFLHIKETTELFKNLESIRTEVEKTDFLPKNQTVH